MDMLTDPRTPQRKPLKPIAPIARPSGCDGIGLVLQGGGALGAYQAGVYQALHEANFEPDWIAGVSIGSINAAIIAGNKPEHRLEKLEKFWLDIPARDPFTLWPEGDTPRKLRNALSAMNGMFFGQPGFFQPTMTNGWFAQRGSRAATSLYDTAPLYKTLETLVDFDLINTRAPRFAVGAVNVATANFLYFDNAETEIGPEENAVELGRRLSTMGASLLVEALAGIEAETIVPQRQDSAQASYAPLLKKEDGHIDWRQAAAAIDNRVRGLQPWPGASTIWRGHALHIWRSRPVALAANSAAETGALASVRPLVVRTGDGGLELLEVQLEGRKRMPAADFANGHRLAENEPLGEIPV